MSKCFTALLIDDHPLITDSYHTALEKFFRTEKEKLDTHIAHDIESALAKINDPLFLKNLDLVFLDISLQGSEKKISSGEDLGIKIRQLSPATKIIVSTSFNDNYRINSLFKNINPEGFLVKNDLDPEVLLLAIKAILSDSPFYSKTVLEFFKTQVGNDYALDEIDRKLLYELSLGTKIVELVKILPLTRAGVEKRRLNLKKIFNLEGTGDRELIQIAREKGFI